VIKYSVQLLSFHVKLIFTVRLEAYSVPFSYALRYEVLIRVNHGAHKGLVGKRLLDVGFSSRYRLHEAIAAISVPLAVTLIHEKLIRLYKECIIFEEASTTLTPTLDVVVKLKYVVVNK
jgi:hypothetical protein